MHKSGFLYTFLILFISASLSGQEYKFRLYLTDKGASTYTIDNPEEYLSQRSIERRNRQNIPVDAFDIPVSEEYISQIENSGCVVVAKSKWLNAVTVHCTDSAMVEVLQELPFIKSAEFVWKGDPMGARYRAEFTTKKMTKTMPSNAYGDGYEQISMNNGQFLHSAGYKGAGMQIAVIDAGYTGFKESSYFSNVNVLGNRDFVYQSVDMFQSSSHGTGVLSCMSANAAYEFIGTAPEAGYWLLRSEDSASEFPIEEDYWVTAAEFADSVGVDLINSSLGYSKFDSPAISMTYEALDGKTSFISQGAEIAAQKGILVVVSAGNEGNKDWKKITPPGDALSVLTVGSVYKDSIASDFSSRGPTFDGRIKPDVMVRGQQSTTINSSGNITTSNGTSYACPTMCGMAACLWQAFPELTNMQILNIIKESSDRYNSPDTIYGYGLPDMKKALNLATEQSSIKEKLFNEKISNFKISTDSIGSINITEKNLTNQKYKLTIVNLRGQKVTDETFTKTKAVRVNTSQKTHYVVTIRGSKVNESFKIYF